MSEKKEFNEEKYIESKTKVENLMEEEGLVHVAMPYIKKDGRVGAQVHIVPKEAVVKKKKSDIITP